MQKRLSPGKLLDEQGNLTEAGYATSLVKEYSRSQVKASALRIKEWDYYLIHNQRFGVALTVADNSYMGLVSISFLDFCNGTEVTKSPMLLLPLGRLHMPKTSETGDVRVGGKGWKFSFENQGDRRILRASMDDFSQGKPIRMKIELDREPEDSMVIATPFDRERTFYYNQKIIGMRARGAVEFQGRHWVFEPGDSWGLLDWGRGVWTYSNTWYWSAMMGKVQGHRLGFNLGYGFGVNENATENMLFYDGKAHKLEKVNFQIPGEKEGNPHFLGPWIFSSSDERVQLTFTPMLDRKAYTSAGVLLSDQHQVFGCFDGRVILDSGEEVPVEHMLGFAEKVRNKW